MIWAHSQVLICAPNIRLQCVNLVRNHAVVIRWLCLFCCCRVLRRHQTILGIFLNLTVRISTHKAHSQLQAKGAHCRRQTEPQHDERPDRLGQCRFVSVQLHEWLLTPVLHGVFAPPIWNESHLLCGTDPATLRKRAWNSALLVSRVYVGFTLIEKITFCWTWKDEEILSGQEMLCCISRTSPLQE